MKVRVLQDFGGRWEGKMFFGQEGQEFDLPDALAKALEREGRVEVVGRAKAKREGAAKE